MRICSTVLVKVCSSNLTFMWKKFQTHCLEQTIFFRMEGVFSSKLVTRAAVSKMECVHCFALVLRLNYCLAIELNAPTGLMKPQCSKRGQKLKNESTYQKLDRKVISDMKIKISFRTTLIKEQIFLGQIIRGFRQKLFLKCAILKLMV